MKSNLNLELVSNNYILNNNDTKIKRVKKLDYKDVTASYGINNIHPYPAMLHFLVVRDLLLSYSNENDNILDPFLGSGVTAVECLINKRNFTGIDINPLAVLISKVRTTHFSIDRLNSYFNVLLHKFVISEPDEVSFKNIDFWFTKKNIQDLSKLKKAIYRIRDIDYRDFYKVVFSDVVRKCSLTRHNEFKLFRKKDLTKVADVFTVFKNISEKYIKEYTTHSQYLKTNSRINIFEGDIIKEGNKNIKNNYYDLVLTSPPYGDSKTTVAYGQFSRLSLQWLGLEENVDKNSLGGQKIGKHSYLPSETLYDVLEKINAIDLKRGNEVLSFYNDLMDAIVVISSKIKQNGHVCFVVGNRKVKGYELPTDIISKDFFEYNGFTFKETLIREISNKRMPAVNSPSNIKGIKENTMRYEYIVVLQKN